MKRVVATILCLGFVLESLGWAGLGADKMLYVGGTINAIKDGTDGKGSAKDEKIFTFVYQGGTLRIPYDQVNDLEYGQKAGRRLGVAIALTWMALFSKKRKHYLTIGYKGSDDKQQAAVFEMGKD